MDASSTSSSPPTSSSSSDAPPTWRPRAPEVASAYVHLPFCRRRCFYCDFAIQVVGDGADASDRVRAGMAAYVDRVCAEIERTPEGNFEEVAADGEDGDASMRVESSVNGASSKDAPRRFWRPRRVPLRTVFFGGGTPSMVPPALVGKILETLEERFGIDEEAEISLEMDPGTFDAAKLGAYVALGVNRVSLGVQSFDPDVLRTAGRAHTVEDAIAAIAAVKANMPGVKRWSLDLISGLPGLTPELWRRSLREAVAARPSHVSVYDLQVRDEDF